MSKNAENMPSEVEKPEGQFEEEDPQASNNVSQNWLAKEDDDNSEIEICRNFANNRCSRGDSCKYRHPKPDGEPRNRSRSPLSKLNENTCRDFLRNMCNRGRNCRYFHPPEGDCPKRSWFTICLDFQNGKCIRHDCRYFHVSPEDEDYFKATGEISFRIIEQAMRKAVLLDVASMGSRPACKDFLQGMCNLRTCRYRHVDRSEFEDEVCGTLKEELTRKLGSSKTTGTQFSRGSFDSFGGRSMNERLGPTASFEEFRGGMGPRMGRDNYPSSEPYSFDGRGNSSHRGRPPVGDSGSFSRDMRPNGMEPLRRNCSPLAQGMYRAKAEEEGVPVGSNASSGMYNSGYNPNLESEVARLQKTNEELVRDLKSGKHWEQIYNDTKIKLEEFVDKMEAQNKQISALDSKVKTLEEYKNFAKEQAYKMENQILVVENELSKSWGGGPPPFASLREAWTHLKTLPMTLTDQQSSEDRAESTGYTSTGPVPSGYNSNPGETYGSRNASAAGIGSGNYNYSQAYSGHASQGAYSRGGGQ